MENLESLRSFVRVVEAGSFSAAGRQLDIAPSSVSRQINEIENHLGARLFHRTTRKLNLTEAGVIFHEHAMNILQAVGEAELAVSQIDGSPSGILRVTAPAGLSRRHIIPAIAAYQQQYPAVKINVIVSDQYLDIVDESIDLAIRVGELSDSSFIAKKIADARIVICASPKYLQDNGVPKEPENLLGHNCINFGSHYRSHVWKFKHNRRFIPIKVSGPIVVNDGESLVASAISGLGIICVPHWLVGGELKQGVLKEILKKHEISPNTSPIYAVYPHQKHLPLKVRSFIDFLASRFQKECRWDCSANYDLAKS